LKLPNSISEIPEFQSRIQTHQLSSSLYVRVSFKELHQPNMTRNHKYLLDSVIFLNPSHRSFFLLEHQKTGSGISHLVTRAVSSGCSLLLGQSFPKIEVYFHIKMARLFFGMTRSNISEVGLLLMQSHLRKERLRNEFVKQCCLRSVRNAISLYNTDSNIHQQATSNPEPTYSQNDGRIHAGTFLDFLETQLAIPDDYSAADNNASNKDEQKTTSAPQQPHSIDWNNSNRTHCLLFSDKETSNQQPSAVFESCPRKKDRLRPIILFFRGGFLSSTNDTDQFGSNHPR